LTLTTGHPEAKVFAAILMWAELSCCDFCFVLRTKFKEGKLILRKADVSQSTWLIKYGQFTPVLYLFDQVHYTGRCWVCVSLVVTGLKGHTKTACVVVEAGVYLFLTSTLYGGGRSVRVHASAVWRPGKNPQVSTGWENGWASGLLEI